ncbi:hypothetical protein [Pseudomonas brassicacearum]|jgi:hypothetical protein|uniref:Uncharacterized protein n=1 Tax=Pseudomonas brassicacearum TaxID=930166 RepID=A0A423J4D1_9PSED|nr:hypothetical protein [Pseudomonas brassicacearum]RON32532.1 hypothetical protein BK664_27675 [Pseudomonas brassicacearum]
MSHVPDHYLGVWQRRLIKFQSGRVDSETAVYWLQTPRLFADLRIPPAPLPALPLEQQNYADWLTLSEQKGFAGVTEVNGDICQWHRKLDYQPVSAEEDIGRMQFETSERLIETALDDSYYEIWERLPDSRGTSRGQWLQAVDDPTRVACLVLAGDYFLFAASRTVALNPGGHLREHIDEASAQQRLACELSFGRHHGGHTPWHIDYSTLPRQVGQRLLSADIDPNASELFSDPRLLSSLGTYAPADGWRCAPEP